MAAVGSPIRPTGLTRSDCKFLATAVVQLFLAEPPDFAKWLKKACGLATFTKDYSRRCYAIQVFDLNACNMAWEQEFYRGFRYYTTRNHFHTFEARDRLAGLNFLDLEEAEKFVTAIRQTLLARRLRKDLRSATKALQNEDIPPPPSFSTFLPAPISNEIGQPQGSPVWNRKEGPGRRRKLRKEDIGLPTNFRCCASTRKEVFALDLRDFIRTEDCGHEWCRAMAK